MAIVRVFVDATAIYSKVERDWLFHARVVTGGTMFSLQTSEDVLNEALTRLRDDNPRWDGGVFSSIRKNVFDVFDEVLTDFPGDVEYPGDDIGDLHVHAAALHANSTMLLTDDRRLLALRDSVDHATAYEPIDFDSFMVLLDESSQRKVATMVQRQINHYSALGQTPALAIKLRAAGAPQFAERVEERTAELGGPHALRAYLATKVGSLGAP